MIPLVPEVQSEKGGNRDIRGDERLPVEGMLEHGPTLDEEEEHKEHEGQAVDPDAAKGLEWECLQFNTLGRETGPDSQERQHDNDPGEIRRGAAD